MSQPNHNTPTAAALRGRGPRRRSIRGLQLLYRIGVFLTGLLFILLGAALAVLPGPLTIPPVLLGLWIWSTEFRFAHRFFERAKRNGQRAWALARRNPFRSAVVTLTGLAVVGVAAWAILKLDLLTTATNAIAH